MDTEKKFNWLAFLFASAYYAGYGKIGKGLVFALAGTVPLAALVANIYAGVKATRLGWRDAVQGHSVRRSPLSAIASGV
jgi:hypothetical protein